MEEQFAQIKKLSKGEAAVWKPSFKHFIMCLIKLNTEEKHREGLKEARQADSSPFNFCGARWPCSKRADMVFADTDEPN